MRNLILTLVIMLAGLTGAYAQTATTEQTANEGFVGYSFVSQQKAVYDTNTHGVNASYTRYLGGSATKAGTVGITGDVSANFSDNNEVLTIATVGLTAKARNSKNVQVYGRALVGGARQNINYRKTPNTSDISTAYILGTGLDVNTTKYSRYKVRLGVDYVNTGFFGERQHGVRLTTGLTF